MTQGGLYPTLSEDSVLMSSPVPDIYSPASVISVRSWLDLWKCLAPLPAPPDSAPHRVEEGQDSSAGVINSKSTVCLIMHEPYGQLKERWVQRKICWSLLQKVTNDTALCCTGMLCGKAAGYPKLMSEQVACCADHAGWSTACVLMRYFWLCLCCIKLLFYILSILSLCLHGL